MTSLISTSKACFLGVQRIRCTHFDVVITGALVVKVPRRDFVAERLYQQIAWTNELAACITGVNRCWEYQGMLIERYAGCTLTHTSYTPDVRREQKRIVAQIRAAGFSVTDVTAPRNWCRDPVTGALTLIDLVRLRPLGIRGREADTAHQKYRQRHRRRK